MHKEGQETTDMGRNWQYRETELQRRRGRVIDKQAENDAHPILRSFQSWGVRVDGLLV